ncbi:MAG: membrane protein insertion efficiency factor YidD [Christensenellaceae bacterium]
MPETHVFIRNISKGIVSQCRYMPTCSQYAYEAILKWGVVVGILLGSWRICVATPLESDLTRRTSRPSKSGFCNGTVNDKGIFMNDIISRVGWSSAT